MIKGVIFDLDGVIIETEPQTFEFFKDYLKQYDIYLKDEDLFKKIGRKSVDFFQDILTPEQKEKVSIQNLIDLKRQKFNENLDKFTRKLPYVEKIIPALKQKGLNLAVASQNEREMIDNVLKKLELGNYFDFVLSLQDIENKKPHPEIYQKAIEKLNLNPEDLVVVEDSLAGITAAKAAGLYCIAVRHPYTQPEHIKAADAVVDSLEELEELI